MRRFPLGAAALVVLIAAVASPHAEAQPAPTTGTREAATAAAPAQKSIRARFGCNRGRSIDATFVNGANSRVELILSDGRKLTVPQAQSASGARYANADESFVFWNKGNTAFIEEAGKTTYDGCATKR